MQRPRPRCKKRSMKWGRSRRAPRVTEGERKATQRYREAVATINAGRKREQAKDRKLRDICDALLLLPPSPGVADVLARFWNKAKRAA